MKLFPGPRHDGTPKRARGPQGGSFWTVCTMSDRLSFCFLFKSWDCYIGSVLEYPAAVTGNEPNVGYGPLRASYFVLVV